MSNAWQTALRKVTQRIIPEFKRPHFLSKDVDWKRLVTIDFETYYDDQYTLSKLSTSEYVRDPRFKAQMMYLKVGTKAPKIVPPKRIAAELKKINWSTHALLCHHTQFDGLILSHHYGVVPSFYYDTLSMARGLHSNEIGAGLDEVSLYYGGAGKIHDVLETTKGVLEWSPALFGKVTPYCLRDGDETLRVFTEMIYALPEQEVDLIDVIVRMFCDPVLKVNIPRVEVELAREIKERDDLLISIIKDPSAYYEDKTVLKMKAERALTGTERDLLIARRIIGSNPKFTGLLLDEGVDPPVKLSPAWMKKTKEEREANEEDKWSYAYAKDDIEFNNLPDVQDRWTTKCDTGKVSGVKAAARKSERLRALVDARLAVKSTTNITRAERLLTASVNGWCLPAYYAYSRAHTHRLGGGDKRNLQNLRRPKYDENKKPIPGTGELRQSIEAGDGHVLVVGDSGQIECRINAFLWGQDDLLDIFRAKGDPYCTMATLAYGRTITKADIIERFVGKVLTLGLGFQMGPDKLQMTLAKGALGGPPVFITRPEAQRWVNIYRAKNRKIEAGWGICNGIIEDMAAGRAGAHGPISWEANKIWLPNGMCLHYPDLKKAMGQNGYEEWTYGSTLNGTPIRKKIYGGLLCENIVQALARIIVMYQLLELSKTYRVVLTTHDEIVLRVKKAEADFAFQRMMKVMTTGKDWYANLPLSAEGGHAHNYSK
jgi:DNA polymerase